jgi:3-deoxy-manno-octulosonate cytidylyltransferase (CMP-KDO synthetase)
MTRVLIVIPARLGSERLREKILADLKGKPMIQWVWEQAQAARLASEVIIATDSERIVERVSAFGGKAMLTSTEHSSGTERIAEVAAKLNFEIVVNLQGDEPLFSPVALDQLIETMLESEAIPMASLRVEILDYHDYVNPSVVKVICDHQDNAIYFSRHPIPFYRGREPQLEQWRREGFRPPELLPPAYKHLGIYGFRSNFLNALVRLPATPLEQAEKLEQLRALAWGFKIKVPETAYDSVSVDTAEDLEKVRKMMGG